MNRHILPIPRGASVAAISFLLFSLLCSSRAQAADTNQPAPDLETTDGLMMAIPKSGIGKNYQFTASIIPQELAPTSTGLSGKIVRFELFPDGVDMYESTQGTSGNGGFARAPFAGDVSHRKPG